MSATTLLVASLLALGGALLVANDSAGLGIAVWVLAAVVSQALLLATVWSRFRPWLAMHRGVPANILLRRLFDVTVAAIKALPSKER